MMLDPYLRARAHNQPRPLLGTDSNQAWLNPAAVNILQDVFLFADTVVVNIPHGRLALTDGEVAAAVQIANADRFLCRLLQG